jgi:hypothetical protein
LLKNVQIRCKSSNPTIIPQAMTYLGAFQEDESRLVAIPIKTGVGLEDNTYNLDIELMSGTVSIERFSYRVTTKRRTEGILAINTPPQYLSNPDGSKGVKLTIANRSKEGAQHLSFRIEPPRGLTVLQQVDSTLRQPLGAGKSVEVSFRYKGDVLRELSGESPKFTCVLLKSGQAIDAIRVDAVPLSNSTENSATFLTWESPNEDEADIQNIAVNKPKFEIKLKAFVNETVSRDQFQIFIDATPLVGDKAKVTDLSAPTPQQKRPIFRTTLDLEPQKLYQIQVRLQLANGSIIASKILRVRYNPEQPNLHVVSIGTPHRDLKYTTKDAKNMAAFFRDNKNLPFKKVIVDEYTDSAKTDYRNFRRAFRDLARRFDEGAENRIEEKDYLVVFISSHGKTGSERNYQLLPSDYDPTNDDAIDYQNDIMNQLNKIKCHKMVLIDACHSGAMKGTKNAPTADALLAISKAATGLTTIVSCDANELSYEDDSWQNGAFTKALLEAFNNQACSDETGAFSSDTNQDQMVSLGEVVGFIKRRVPKLVALQKRQTGQNPVVIHDELDKEIPISVVPK